MAFGKLVFMLVLIHNAGGSSIVGGQDAPKGRWPWMVHLNITSNGIYTWRCGATILNSQWLLTAASCLTTYPPSNAKRSMAWIGSYQLRNPSVRYMRISYNMSHPHFGVMGNGYVNDIAVVKLEKKINLSAKDKFVAAVTLASVDDTFTASSECWITGWGEVETGVHLPDPETLQQLKIPIVPQNVCKAKNPLLTSNMLCAGDMAGGKDACKGDYGGPLVCKTPSGFKQVGIMSYGSRDCAAKGHPGVYTQVSKYLDFINAYINQGEEASAEV